MKELPFKKVDCTFQFRLDLEQDHSVSVVVRNGEGLSAVTVLTDDDSVSVGGPAYPLAELLLRSALAVLAMDTVVSENAWTDRTEATLETVKESLGHSTSHGQLHRWDLPETESFHLDSFGKDKQQFTLHTLHGSLYSYPPTDLLLRHLIGMAIHLLPAERPDASPGDQQSR